MQCSGVAYDVGLSQLYDNQLNSSLQCSSEHSTTINKTPHEVGYAYPRNTPRQNHLSFPTKADLPDNLPTRRHPTPTPISENSSANGCSRNFKLFPFFRVFIKFFGGALAPRPPASYAYGQPTYINSQSHHLFTE